MVQQYELLMKCLRQRRTEGNEEKKKKIKPLHGIYHGQREDMANIRYPSSRYIKALIMAAKNWP